MRIPNQQRIPWGWAREKETSLQGPRPWAREASGNLLEESGADARIRTADLLITNQLLYRLSYVGPEGP